MPGPHNMPGGNPMSNRRQHSDYNHNHYHYSPAHAPTYYPSYPQSPGYYGHNQPHPYAPQWYPQYPQQHHQYAAPPRQYQQSHHPVVVSSHPPHMQSPPTFNRQDVTTPPIVNSHPSPAPSIPSQQLPTVQPAPPTPSVSSQAAASPQTPATEITTATPPPAEPLDTAASTPRSQAAVSTQIASLPEKKEPFKYPLPWLSVPGEPFPERAPRRRRRREPSPLKKTVEIPSLSSGDVESIQEHAQKNETETEISDATALKPLEQVEPATGDILQEKVDSASEFVSEPKEPVAQASQSSTSHGRAPTIPAIPILPLRTAVPQKPKSPRAVATGDEVKSPQAPQPSQQPVTPTSAESAAPISSPPKPKSWAELVRTKGTAKPAAQQDTGSLSNGSTVTNSISAVKNGTMSEVLGSYSVQSDDKLAFLEPRGLVNTGNMCYMNSVLQTLVFCVPFHDFLDQVGKRAAHSFKSDTPLIDAMIMFLREFKVIDSAISVEQLRMRLKDAELEQYGDAFTPEYVYDVIRRLPRFAHMRRGHQQDAEEFLGFLLAGLHDECAQIMSKTEADAPTANSDIASPPSTSSTDAGWMEVGPKQKSAITRSSGSIEIESPITKIFGGKLRSELRVPGAKHSITLEPYQPLQLDIGARNVNNIIDALKGLTQPETLHGDFNTAKGPGTSAVKQVFIENLPPVLILHLKRFQYDNAGGTQKIWKKVGYPLDLEIPREVFPPSKRAGLVNAGLPRYRLISVVYHHGKNASGGHYTVDVRRQEGREWIRIDDTVIRRIRSEDVAEGGSEEDPRVLAAALEQHKRDSSSNRSKNIYEMAGLDGDDDAQSDGGWKDASTEKGRRWAGVVNGSGTGPATPGTTTGKATPKEKAGYKDNKVAYILFYQQIRS